MAKKKTIKKQQLANTSTNLEWLPAAIKAATKATKFCVAGSLPAVEPGLEVAGLGDVEIPLKRGIDKKLITACRVAPYGKGTQTLVDRRVRNTYELDPENFDLSDEWESAIAEATRTIAEQLGLPADELEAKPYKLLVYEKGGFFLPHRDSEKQNRMVASLIVVLPNPFAGGRLIVRHGNIEQKLDFKEAASGQAACFAAFYADCEHEVQRVNRGVRIALAYNLVLKKWKRPRSKGEVESSATTDTLAASIESWVAKQPANPLVFALEHHYTERGLSLDLLKGADRQLADLVVAAAEKADCLVHLAQVERHLMQFADDGSFGDAYGDRYRSRRRRQEIEIGETYEDDLSGTQWTELGGKQPPWGKGEIGFDLSAIVSSIPIDDWKPTSEEFEGYTGNAGNTLDRWYHRSAIVVWHRDHHFEVIAKSGQASSVPLFCSMAAKLAKTPKKRFEEARLDCIRFARAIIERWPKSYGGHGYFSNSESSKEKDFQKHLLMLHDRDTIAMFLAKVAEYDRSVPLKSLILAACREFGWGAFAREMKALLSAQPSVRFQQDIPPRDIEWLVAYCCETKADGDRTALAHTLCDMAVERFVEPRTSYPRSYSPGSKRSSTASEQSLPPLLKALLCAGRDAAVARVIDFVQNSPDEFSLDQGQIPCLKLLIPWSQKQFGPVPPRLVDWLSSVRQWLESATAEPPAPPADWARAASVDCRCKHCAQLNKFLADPDQETVSIATPEYGRAHLLDQIRRYQCDVKHTLDRKRRPYALVLTKTTGSFERAVKEFEENRKLLKSLPLTP
jgi:hypothetical protein